uniref:DUF148 domain-containing protein n=1 Tax=Strongyloides stercoralis TaxID=6248 RepID=A0A0K0EIS0_STRER
MAYKMYTPLKHIIVSIFLFGVAFCDMESTPTLVDGPGVPGGPWGMGNENGPMMGHGMMHHMPPFLQSVSPEDAQAFMDIEKSTTMTKADIQAAEDAWAASKNQTIKSLYDEFKANKASKISEMKNTINQKVSSLSSTAQKVVTDIESVVEDTGITRDEQRQKIKAILDGATNEDKDAIKSLMPHFEPKMGQEGMGQDGSPEKPDSIEQQ